MLDVHIAVSSDTPKEWVDQCVDSVHVAAKLASYPVHVYVIDGVPGHIGKTRAMGYSHGTSLYKTYVDDDDYVTSEMFESLAECLGGEFAAIFTHETRLQNGVFLKSPTRHHLAVYRTDVLAGFDFEKWKAAGDVATKYIAETHPDGVRTLPVYHYIHRIYPRSKASSLRKLHEKELREAVWQTY